MLRRQASLLEHHALEVPRRPGGSEHGHARLPWREGQLLGPLESLHQMRVGSLRDVASRVEVRLPRVADGGGAPVGLGHEVGRGDAALLHPGVHGSRVVHVARHGVSPLEGGGLRAVLGGSVVAVQVQDFFWALGLLQVVFLDGFCWTADGAAGAPVDALARLAFPVLRASRMRSRFGRRTGRQQRGASGAFGANGGHVTLL